SANTPKLRIDLLGGCSAGLEGDGPRILPTRKSQALLAYLAVPAGRFHTREKLTTMFWRSHLKRRQRIAGESTTMVPRGPG
ncbi:MAG TPA: hypothetical protein VHX39_29825, partial [Acetobacteraceae bacterium]|nr:hypothetical protein [Acetobacteraceae bacterium]